MNEAIKEIIEAGVQAPSGDNSQPWRFEVRGNTINAFNLPKQDKSLYNFQQRGSFLAHGALIENIIIAASTHGLSIDVKLFPDAKKPDHISTLTLQSKKIKIDPLAPYISRRATNRKPYKATPLNARQKQALLKISKDTSWGNIKLVEDAAQKHTLATALSLNDCLILENPTIHRVLFSKIRWNEKQEKTHRSGLYLKTLALPPPKAFAFRLFRYRPIVKVMIQLGAPQMIAKETAELYASSAALGALYMENDTPTSYLNAGRLLQRFWLTLMQYGLSLQPVTGVVYLAERVIAGDTAAFSRSEASRIVTAYETIRRTFGFKNEAIAMTFRIGDGGEPVAYSSRRSPQISFVS